VFFTVIVYDLSMDDNHDPEREAEEAMKFAIAAAGADRHRLIRLDMAWHVGPRPAAGSSPPHRAGGLVGGGAHSGQLSPI
jgi:hypothetical protein